MQDDSYKNNNSNDSNYSDQDNFENAPEQHDKHENNNSDTSHHSTNHHANQGYNYQGSNQQQSQSNNQNNFQNNNGFQNDNNFNNQNQNQIQNTNHTPTNTGQIILQWLTYALWGWTVLLMSILTGMVMASLVADADISSVAYPVAAVLVLMPAAFIVDSIYSKIEPQQKTGAASIIMVLHAVLFALLGIGSLIVIVFCIVSLVTSSEDHSGTLATFYSFIIIAILYALTFLRTLAPPNMPYVKKYFRIGMVVVVGVVALAGIFGPAAKERQTKTDRLIENNLYLVSDNINSYVEARGMLPESVDQLELTGDAAKLFSDNLVVYKPNTIPQSKKLYDGGYNYTNNTQSNTQPKQYDVTFYYQLCANYKNASKGDSYGQSYDKYSYSDNSGYSSYMPSSSSHPAGEKCYKLSATKLAT